MASECRNLKILYVESPVEPGEYCSIICNFQHRWDAATMRLYVAIGQKNAWFNEFLSAHKDISIPQHFDWSTVSGGVNILIQGLSSGSYDVYAKLTGPGPDLITEALLDAIEVRGVAPPPPPPEEEVLVDSTSITIPYAEETPPPPGGDVLVHSTSITIPYSEETPPPPGGDVLVDSASITIPYSEIPANGEPPIACTINADCPEGYVCKDGVCVKEEKEIPWTWIALGAGALILLLPGKNKKKTKQ